MDPRRLALAFVLAGCTDPARGEIHVVAHSYHALPVPAATDALVVVVDGDGTRTTRTDAEGRATAQLQAGGSVWVLDDAPPMNNPGPIITVYTDVQPGDTIEVGPEPRAQQQHAARGTMQVVGAPPAGTESIQFASNCLASGSGGATITFDDRCAATAEVLLLATHFYGGVSGTVLEKYIWLPAQPITDGGTITVDPNAWQAPTELSLSFVNAGGPVTYSVSSAFGNVYQQGNRVPAAGMLRVAGGVNAAKGFELQLPSTAVGMPIDLDHVLTPSITTERLPTGSIRWRIADDAGGARVTQASGATFNWIERTPSIDRSHQLRVLSPAASGGTIESPTFPGPLAEYAPPAELISEAGYASARIVRVEGIDSARAKRLADVGTYVLIPELAAAPAWSLATTELQ